MGTKSVQYCVREYGAAGDGISLDTEAIQNAIDECSANKGGTVYFPNGEYLTGTLYLRSNVTLFLEVSATLLGSPLIEHYASDTHKQRYNNESFMDRCLLYGEDLDNVIFAGSGMIHGQGQMFPNPNSEHRPMLMRFLRCRNVRLSGLRLREPASWTTAFILCDTVYAESLDILSRANKNGDGLDFDSCQNVFIANCKIDTSDDSICLQSSERNHSCRNIMIQNCLMTSQWAALRVGLLSSGDIEDVAVSNCVFHDLKCSGFKIQSTEGGHIRNMVFQNIVMRNVTRPIFLTLNHFRMGVDTALPLPETGGISNLKFHHMIITNEAAQTMESASGIVINGTPGYSIEDITISDVDYTAVGGIESSMGSIEAVPELTNKRPEAGVYKEGLPSYGLYIRYAKGIRVESLHLKTLREDGRSAVVCQQVEDLTLDGIKGTVHMNAKSFIRLHNTRNVKTRNVVVHKR
jgi:polygalacturonase